jgi:molecular chaperone GrpE
MTEKDTEKAPRKDNDCDTPSSQVANANAASETPSSDAESVEAEIIEEAETAEDAEETAEAAEASSEEKVDELLEEVEAEADLAEELKKAQESLQDANDKYLRLHAEWDTYRRRMTEEKAEAKKQANEKIISSLIPVLDDFERTIDYGVKNGEKGLLDGIKAVYSKLVDTLEKDGVEVINPVGEAYDSLVAQAVQMVEDTSVPDETVASVFQKGYKLGIKIIRPAMVTVATGGPKREKPEEE